MLLIPLCYIQFGYFGQFIVLQWRMKEAAREARVAALPDAVMMRVSLAELNASGRWEDEGKECWYKGHLYDVIRQRTVDGATWLYCLDDEGEERLIDGSVAVTRAGQDLPAKRNGHSLTISDWDMVCQTVNWELRSLPRTKSNYSPAGNSRLAFSYSDIVIPPPKGTPVLCC